MHINNYRKIAANEYDAWNKLSFYLAPPIFSFIKDKKTQNPKKFKIPGLIAIPIFHVLEKLSFLRGTPFDIFKYSRERKTDYEHKKVFEEEFLIAKIVSEKSLLDLWIIDFGIYCFGIKDKVSNLLSDPFPELLIPGLAALKNAGWPARNAK